MLNTTTCTLTVSMVMYNTLGIATELYYAFHHTAAESWRYLSSLSSGRALDSTYRIEAINRASFLLSRDLLPRYMQGALVRTCRVQM